MAELSPNLLDAIEEAVGQVRASLVLLYSNGDIGKIEVNCGKTRIVVKALPERINNPVNFVSTE